MVRSASIFAALLIAPFAAAQEAPDPWAEPAGWETEGRVGASALYAFDDGEPVWRAFASGRADLVLDSGLEIGATGRLEAQADHPARPGFSGANGFGPAIPAGQAGALSGLSSGPLRDAEAIKLSVESAYVFASGGYGEARLGIDEGIGKRFTPTIPSVFSTATSGAARLDSSGLAYVRTDHDLTGPSAKVSATSPRLLGVQAGASFTPEAHARGLDRDPRWTPPGGVQAELTDALELGLNATRTFRSAGLETEAGLAWSEATVSAAGALPERTAETWSGGVKLATDRFALGASGLQSQDEVSGRDYEAIAFGVTAKAGDYTLGLEYGDFSDEVAAFSGDTRTAAVTRKWGEFADISLGWREERVAPDVSGRAPRRATQGIVIEITLSP